MIVIHPSLSHTRVEFPLTDSYKSNGPQSRLNRNLDNVRRETETQEEEEEEKEREKTNEKGRYQARLMNNSIRDDYALRWVVSGCSRVSIVT